MRGIVLSLGLAMACILTPAHATPGTRDGRFVVPHIPWAKPLAGEPLKTLAIVPINGGRDLWDLAECLDLDLTVLTVQDAAGHFGGPQVFGNTAPIRYWGLAYDEQLAKARAALDGPRYQLILLANVCLSSLPPEIANRVSVQVVAGAGLVMTNAKLGDLLYDQLYTATPANGDPVDLLRPLPFEALLAGANWEGGQPVTDALAATTAYDATKGFAAYTVGAGRFYALPFPFQGVSWGGYASVPALIPGIRINMANRWQEDLYYAMVAKACLWATHREPLARIADLEYAPTDMAARAVITANTPFSGELRVELRDAITNQLLASDSVDLAMAEGHREVSVPVGHFLGRTTLIARLIDAADRVLDFAAACADVAPPEPATLALDHDLFGAGAPITGTIKAPDGTAITLTLFDAQGRIWEQGALQAEATPVRFSLPIRSPAILHGLRAVASRGDAMIAMDTSFFTVGQPRDSYYVTVSDEPWPTWHTMRRYERIREWGGDGARDHKPSIGDAIAFAIAGIDMNPGRPHVPGPKALDPAFVNELVAIGDANCRLYRHFNQAMYNTTDDCGPKAGFVPTAMPRFLDWLGGLYGYDVGALNREWETEFAAFTDIPADLVKHARRDGNIPIWSDYLHFTGETYIAVQRTYRQAIRAVDPTATAGCDAVYYEASLPSLYRELGYIMPYYNPLTVEVGRSLSRAEPPVYTGICTGVYAYYRGTESYCRMMPWHILLSGNNSILFWSLLAGFEGDLSIGGEQLVGWMMDEISRIKLSGAAQWIVAADRAPAGVAILYSEASRRAELAGSLSPQLEDAAAAFQEIIEDQGLQYDYISTRDMVEYGVLANGDYRLLILPRSIAMSAAEVTAVERFVELGGMLWADSEPAVRNDHGRLLPNGQLDHLFGVAHKPDGTFTMGGGEPLAMINGKPRFIRHATGKGECVLFNQNAAFYGATKGGISEVGSVGRRRAPALAAYDTITRLLGPLAPAVRPSLDDGPPVGVELTRYALGDGMLFAVEVKSVEGQNWPAALHLPLDGTYAVHELRSGRDWPPTDVLNLKVSSNDVFVFSLLPAIPLPLALDAPDRLPAGATVTATCRNVDAPTHTVFVFVLTDPAGVVRRDYQQRLTTSTGAAECAIPLPHNVPPGTWSLTVSDLLTGATATHAIRIEEDAQ